MGVTFWKNHLFPFLKDFWGPIENFLGGALYIPKCVSKTLIKKIICAWVCILKIFFTFFDKLSVIYGDFFWPISWWNLIAFCLSFPKWCNTYTFVEEIKALEYQTFSTHFLSNFMFFWITQKVTFFTHPNDFLGNNSNNPMGTTGFHAFFENSWLSPLPQ